MRVIKGSAWFMALPIVIACGSEGSSVTKNQDPVSATCECPIDWMVENLAVCVSKANSYFPTIMYSSHLTASGEIACDAAKDFPQPVSDRPWSEQRVQSPCQGSGKLCVSLRQGSAETASKDDCLLHKQCLEFDYEIENESMELPPLAAFSVDDAECAGAYEKDGGYIEFEIGDSDFGCGEGGRTIRRVNTCPVGCDQTPSAERCRDCSDVSLVSTF